MNTLEKTTETSAFLVRVRGHAVKFHTDLAARQVYSLVADEEATLFRGEQAAIDTARLYNIFIERVKKLDDKP